MRLDDGAIDQQVTLPLLLFEYLPQRFPPACNCPATIPAINSVPLSKLCGQISPGSARPKHPQAPPRESGGHRLPLDRAWSRLEHGLSIDANTHASLPFELPCTPTYAILNTCQAHKVSTGPSTKPRAPIPTPFAEAFLDQFPDSFQHQAPRALTRPFTRPVHR